MANVFFAITDKHISWKQKKSLLKSTSEDNEYEYCSIGSYLPSRTQNAFGISIFVNIGGLIFPQSLWYVCQVLFSTRFEASFYIFTSEFFCTDLTFSIKYNEYESGFNLIIIEENIFWCTWRLLHDIFQIIQKLNATKILETI